MKSSKRLISFLLFFAMSIGLSPFSYAQTTAASNAAATATCTDPTDPTCTGTGDNLGTLDPETVTCNATSVPIDPTTTSPSDCTPWAAKVNKACTDYQTAAQSCNTNHRNAGYACLGGLNSSITTAVAVINGLLSAVSAVSVSSSCSTFGQAMQVARDALSAYSLACGGAQALCGSSCSAAVTAAKNLQAAVNSKMPLCTTAAPGPSAAASTALSSTPNSTVTGKNAMCSGKYAALLASGAAGVVSMVASAMEGSNCDSSSSTTDLSVICSEAAYTNTTQCICYRNPTTAGCADASSASTTGNSFGATTSTTAGTTTGTALLTDSGDSGVSAGSPSSSDGADGAPPPSGGSGLGGGDAGGTGGSTGSGAATASKINTNLLGGASGGGGGGGWGSALNAAEEKLKAYMPGGAADPNAAGSAAAAQVTGAGGLSNWEKVRARYLDDKTTLLGN